MSATYKGSSASVANPSKRNEKWLRSGVQEVTLEVEGRYSDLVTIRSANPAGTVLSGYSAVYVTDASIKRDGKGDLAVLTIEATSAVDPSEFSGTTVTTKSVTWQRIDQDMRFHSIFQAGGTYAIDTAGHGLVDYYLGLPDSDWKSDVYTNTLTANERRLVDKLARGQTHYAVYIPVVRKTATGGTPPTISGVGQIDTAGATAAGGPAQSGNGETYTYVKTADESNKQGGESWVRTEEWTGFEYVDPDVVY
jgi:hypothetical protein